ncbi:MAG: beta-lactamase family protein [Planctomycetaceae bacterium]|nr:beta-lactamase family protein [Planctomycetaceae bacterium]
MTPSRYFGLKSLYATVFFCVVLAVPAACSILASDIVPPVDQGIDAALKPHVENSDEITGVVTVLARQNGTILSQNVLGYSDIETGREMQPDDLFWIASMTKPITAAAVMILVDEGKVSLDDPVTKFIPALEKLMVVESREEGRLELARPVRGVTVRQLLCHTAGFTFLSELQGFGLDVISMEFASLPSVTGPLQFQPGDSFIYSNQGINIAGRVIEVASGMSYAEFLQQRIFDPLGMTDTTFWPDEQQLARLAKSYRYNELQKKLEEVQVQYLNYPLNDRVRRHAEPGGGLFSTAQDCTKFCLMLANEGEWDGQKILTRESVSELKKDQTSELKLNYGLCFDRSDNHFGHGGAYGTRMAIDLRRNIVSVFLVQCAGSPKSGSAMNDYNKAVDKLLEQSP